MNLNHITESTNVIDLQTSFVPTADWLSMFGPATRMMPVAQDFSNEVYLFTGLAVLTFVAAFTITISIRFYR